jgi:RNA polymerase sigma-70 factor (ECF subfamily)
MADVSGQASDLELVRAVCAGCRLSFDQLVDRYVRGVHAVAARIVRHAADAEDVTQETFIRAYERLYLFDQQHEFRNWLFKIATNLAINRLRSRRREQVLKFEAAERLKQQASGDGDALELPGDQDWHYWLGQLDEQYRAAIVLFHFSEMGYQEVADALDIPLNTVRTLLHRGRRQLRELMGKAKQSENGSCDAANWKH